MDHSLEFKDLGFTENESKVYNILLRFGKSTAGHLSKESKVPYGRIYNVLDSLEEKGFVRVIPEPTKHYVATDPDKFQSIIDDKIKSLMGINDKVKEMKKLYDDNTKESVIAAKGKSNFIKITREIAKAKQTSYTIKYSFDTNPEFIRNTLRREKEGVQSLTLGRLDEDTKKNIEEWAKVKNPGRQIPNEGIAMEIVDEEEVMIALIKSNTTLLIRDKPFAKLMKELYSNYYTNAKPLVDEYKDKKK